jgi:DNA polymerase III subunit delta'
MLVGHKEQQKKLNLLFKKDEIPHAFLFSGPGLVGKKQIAWWFLKKINCEAKTKKPCEVCTSCKEIERGLHTDILSIFPEDKEIKLKKIEEVVEGSYYKGAKAQYKGVVIDDAHLMNSQAQNALLKTLEEPPGKTVIILVTEYPHTLLSTILSRVFEIKFSLLTEKEIEELVKDKEIAKLSFGKPGKGIEYLKSSEKREEAKKNKVEAEKLMQEDVAFRFEVIKRVVEEKKEEEFLIVLLKLLQEKMHRKLAKKERLGEICEAIKETEEVIFLLSKTNINVRLALEKIILKV